MPKIEFINELIALGYNPVEPDSSKIYFEYVVPVGPNIGKKILVGFEIGNNFPASCPSGPHFKSIGIEGWKEPSQNIHDSPFGPGWRYWSRPFPDWNRCKKTVKVYLAHIKNLLVKL
ncbi:MAG: hypothetical protein KDH95_18895 [Calditrichaeota bacterium]|nr:hypothetical protein [Calditrichota bacterium]MCB0270231.1 hypothetical protein [Calditrichota bacterium]